MLHRNGKTIAKSLIAVAVVVMFIMGTASVFAEVDDHTVVGKNPQGTVINLFDYWTTSQEAGDFTPNPNLNSGINKNRDLKFSMGNNASGMNNWTGSSAPYSGMVQNTLDSNGYPTLRTSYSEGIFYTTSLDYLFNNYDSTTDGASKVEGKKAYTNVDGLMQVNDDGYYYYDSTRNFASYDSTTNGMKLYNKPAVQFGNTNGQFFPFNSGSQVFDEVNKSLRAKGVNAGSSNVNHWFGVSMSTHFMQPVDGKTTTNKDITYEFSGDDDVWVYIDGVLVGDLGGIHDAASLNINFSTGAISINGKSDGTLKSKYEAAGKKDEIQWKGNTFADNTYHTLKFFYLERGNYASNMSLKFNLKLMPDNEISKVDQYGNAVKGAEYALYEATRTETNGETAYKETGRQLCSGSTSANGSLILKADDGATINFEELYKKDIGPYYILRETKAPDGYRKTKPVWLEYDPKTGAVTTENQWDSGIHANSRIMITAPTVFYDREGNQISQNPDGTLREGSVFAIVYKKTGDSISGDSNWSAVSGSVLDGWQLHTADTTEHVLQGNKYEMKLNSMGAYETTLEELPGDIMTYSNVIVADNKGKSQEEIQKALEDKVQYYISYYYTKGDVKDASVSNTKRLDTGILSTNQKAKEYDYQYAVKLTATDVTNDLYVQKQSSTSVGFNNACINGVKFALYPEDQTTLLSGLPGRDVKLQEGAKPVQEQVTGTIGADVAGSELYGSAVFKKLKNGIYYLKEISAPSGYKLNEKLVKVVVNDNGVYADAGTQGDGVLVSRGGYGMLLKSMEQFAENNDINTTLTNMIAKLRVSEREPNVDGTWDKPMEFGADMHLRYNYDLEQGGTGHYQIWSQDNEGHENFSEITENMEAFSTDTGWPSVVLNQCQEHDTGSKTAKKTDLGNKDLSHLFVLDTIVAVQDEPVGDLEISKKVENNSSGISYSDKAFDFTVNLTEYDTQDKVTGSNIYKPLSGTFQYTVTHKDGTTTDKELVVNEKGNGEIQLKDGETAVIKDIPSNVHYKVTEEAEGYWNVSSAVKGTIIHRTDDPDGYEPTFGGKEVTGSIPKPDDNGNKQKQIAEYTNTYDSTPATLELPVEKLFNGWNLDSFKDQTFAIRLTGLGSTGGDIKDTMPGAVKDTQDNHWYLTKSIGNNETASHDDGPLTVNPFVSSTSEFTGLKFTKTGQYAYTIKEIQGDHQDISYSAAIYEVLVTVTDNPDTGKLTASYTMKKTIDDDGTSLTQEPQPNGTATFKNEYENKTANVNFSVHKTYTNATGSDTLTDNQFQFQLEPVTDKAPMPEGTQNNKYTASTTAGGRTAFPNITYNTEDQGKEFDYKVSEVVPGNAVDGKLAGTTYDMNTYYIRVKVSGTGSAVNAEIKYYKDATCTQEVPENEMYTIGDEHRLWFHNSYTAEPAKVIIRGSKKLNGRDMAANEFGFTLEGADDTTKEAVEDGSVQGTTNGKLTVQAAAASDDHEQGFKFPDLTFNHVGNYTFKVTENIPQDAQNNKLNGVTYDTNVGTVTVQVTDKDANGNKTGQLQAAVSYQNSRNNSTDLAQFINKYAESGSAKIEGTKNLAGRDFKDGDSFTFMVIPKDGAPAPKDKDGKDISEVTITPDSGASAKIDFGTVNFTKAGQSYTYELKEKQPGGDKKGIEYDATTYTLTLTAKANSPKNGKLTIEQTLKAGDKDADQIVWNNQYKPTGSLRLDATKTLTGRKWKQNDSFIFELWAYKSDALLAALDQTKTPYTVEGSSISFGKVTATAPAADAENQQTVPINFETLHFTKASEDGPFEFYITEIPGNDKGMNYDSQPHRIPVEVTDDGEGHLTAKVEDSSITNLNFNNVYNSSVEYSNKAGLVIQKTLNGRDMTAGQFEFTVEAQDSVSGDTAVTAHQAAGKLGFGQGETNKVFQSVAATDGTACSIDILDGQKVEFNQDDAGKTFCYKVTETKGGADGYTNDTTEYRVEIALEDLGAGAMKATTTVTDVTHKREVSETEVRSDDPDGKKIAVIPFTNSYSASGELGGQGSAKIEASKTLKGRTMKKDEFTFQVTNANDTKEQKTVLSTGKNAVAEVGKPGAVNFSEIKYTTAQLKQDVENGLAVKEGNEYTYQYEVSEVTENLPAGVSPEEGSFAVTVTVTDNGDGTLTAAVTYPDDKNKLNFVNDYDTKTVFVPIKGIKSLKLEGKAAMTIEDIEGKYDFALTGKETTAGEDGTAPMPTLKGKTMTSAKNDKTGEIDFGHITLQASDFEGIEPDDQGNRTRTFEYKITEKGNVDGVVNDREAMKTVSITVMYSKEKSFHVTGVPEDAAFQFTNIYGITSTDVSADTLFSVNKILKGRDLKDGEFQFELLELVDDEAVGIAKGTHGAASAGKASAVDFGKITYDAPGEHDYLIREVVPSGGRDADTVYDTRSYSVHVSVTDQKDGTLKVTSDVSTDKPMTFTNKQVSKNPSGGDSTGDNGGNGGSHTRTGDQTPVGMAILLLMISACAGTLVLGIRRSSAK